MREGKGGGVGFVLVFYVLGGLGVEEWKGFRSLVFGCVA